MPARRLPLLGIGLVAAGSILLAAAAALGPAPGVPPGRAGPWGMVGPGMAGLGTGPHPGSPGFVAGTAATPRIVRVIATDALRFQPDIVVVQEGETITFAVTTMGMVSHEFMVGPAADVATHTEGAAEIDDIGPMQTRFLTYTFAGPGPFAFACHEPGHFEAGMTGTIVVVP